DQLFAADRIPQARGAVPAGGNQEVASVAEFDDEAQPGVSFQDGLQAPLGVIPDVEALVGAGCGQEPAVAPPGQADDFLVVFVARADFFSRLHIKYGDAAAIRSERRRQLLAGRMKEHATGTDPIAEPLDLPARG